MIWSTHRDYAHSINMAIARTVTSGLTHTTCAVLIAAAVGCEAPQSDAVAREQTALTASVAGANAQEPIAPEQDAMEAAEEAVGFTGQARAVTQQLLNNYTLTCLDSNTAQSVYLHSCNNGNFQRWTITSLQQLKNVSTGYCLDSNSAGNVYTRGCNSGNFQKWRHSGWQLVDVATGLCLDVSSSGKPYTHACNTGDRQVWVPQPH
jgi:hypothetical protein